MTIIERIEKAIKNYDAEKDSIDKVIAMAYFIGREQATKELSDKIAKVFEEQKKRALKSRYHNIAMNVQGNISYVYSADYSQGMTESFGSDETEV